MGRRCRHISWKAYGAAQAFDARQISGASDGSTVETWTDLGTGGNNATQSDSAKRPVYRIGANGLNNQPVLQFDGTDDEYTHSFSQSTSSTAAITLGVCTTAQTGFGGFYFTLGSNQAFRTGASAFHDANTGNKYFFTGYTFDGGTSNLPNSSLSPAVVIDTYDGSGYRVAFDGRWEASTTAGAGYSDAFLRRLIGREANFAASKIAILCTVEPAPSRSTLQRLSHSISRSYKLSSS
jgi:hypothetical protein